LKSASGSNAKQAILTEHKDNELFKEFMRVTYDPAISYFISKCPIRTHDFSEYAFSKGTIDALVFTLAGRDLTGGWAAKWLQNLVNSLNSEGQELLKLLINRSVGAGIGDTMTLKTWPNLFFTVSYQRCSLLDAKAKERFSKMPLMMCQEKCDGSFLYLLKEQGKPAQAITRAGSMYPQEFTDKISEGIPEGIVLIGELLAFTNPQYDGKMDVLDRQTGNGRLNSILKGGDMTDDLVYKMFAWDCVSVQEFREGKSKMDYDYRLDNLHSIVASNTIPNVEFIHTEYVSTLEEAYKVYSSFTAIGKEGAVLKNPHSYWSNGTSKDMVKMKISFEIDLEVEEIVEGSGKYTSMMGAVKLKSRCGKLRTDVGTGFSDQQRKDIFEFGLPKIVTIKANDIIGKRGSDTFSCFLPVFLEARLDKTVADTYDECVAQLNAAKGIV
jgi:DNA ligase-1